MGALSSAMGSYVTCPGPCPRSALAQQTGDSFSLGAQTEGKQGGGKAKRAPCLPAALGDRPTSTIPKIWMPRPKEPQEVFLWPSPLPSLPSQELALIFPWDFLPRAPP